MAEPIDQPTVVLTLPKKYPLNIVSFLTEIEQLQVEPYLPARIVIDERSGVVVIAAMCAYRRSPSQKPHSDGFRNALESVSHQAFTARDEPAWYAPASACKRDGRSCSS
jgi:hypothetical protein